MTSGPNAGGACGGEAVASAVPLYLASTSPRRCALLDEAGIDFVVVTPGPEPTGHGSPLARAQLRARSKALGAAVPLGAPSGTVLGVDTVVEVDGDELGKPLDRAEAAAMLMRLAGREHLVHTAHCLRPHPATPTWLTEHVATARVAFAALDAAAIEAYLATGEWEGKAGGYAIQGAAGAFCTLVEGERDVVIGLSVAAVRSLRDAAGSQPTGPGRP